ncbi:MAG: hypothetical protein AAGJ35_04715, partial [Myxococcota bacterium]
MNKAYFQSYRNYFWQWEEHATVLTIPNGSTIAYREQIGTIVAALCPDGLPPFGALLLALIATNNTVEDTLERVSAIIETFFSDAPNGSAYQRETFAQALSFLHMLRALPERYRTGDQRVLLLQTLFRKAHNKLGQKRSKGILLGVTQGILPEFKTVSSHLSETVFLSDFRAIALLRKKFPDEETLLAKMAEVPDAEMPLETLEEAPVTTPKDFVSTLLDNPKTFHVGALLTRIWSGLRVPYQLAVPGEQALGGVSDLTNKGDFAQLLVSEFANDDLSFLLRLANNEALYFHREAPPASDRFERILLIDVSLKNWGTPKVLAYAVMLAIAKHPKSNIRCRAFAVGKDYHPIAFDSIHEIIDSLQMVDGSLESSQGLERFLKAQDTTKNTEIFFISTTGALQHAPMQQLLNDYHAVFTYWVNVSSEGNITLFKNRYKSKKLVHELQLPLKALWEKPSNPRTTARPSAPKENTLAYPILFPVSKEDKKLLATDGNGDQFLYLKESGHLLRRPLSGDDVQHKGLYYENDLGRYAKGMHSPARTAHGDLLLFCFLPQKKKEGLLYNFATKEKHFVPFPEWKHNYLFPEFFYYPEKHQIVHIGKGKYWTLSCEGTPTLQKYSEHAPKHLQEAYHLARGETKVEEVKGHINILKNIKRIFINNVDNLVFNTHELRWLRNDVLNLESTAFKTQVIEARLLESRDGFAFPDGSKIMNNKSGILKLNSSHPTIDTIYLPAVPGVPLGVATHEYFAGIDYYYPSERQKAIEKVDMKTFYTR